jgi:2-polyprenyl-3-methyl-5-hydroxy-6-metoxy-1,4-benzoquinol methylase
MIQKLETARTVSGPRAIPAVCTMCGSSALEAVPEYLPGAVDGPWKVARCVACTQMVTDPRPHPNDWHHFYPDDYTCHQVKRKEETWHTPIRLGRKRSTIADEGRKLRLRSDGRLAPEALARLASLSDPYLLPPFGQGRLLDFGCGSGKFLGRMKGLGWNVTGLDYSSNAAATARAAFDVPVHVGSLPHPELPDGHFDLVTSWQVVEHLDQPRVCLGAARRVLRDGGLMAVTVPNIGGTAAKWFGRYWYGLDMPRHINHFTPESIARMMEAEGFRIVRVRTVSMSGWIRHAARLAKAHGGSAAQKAMTSKILSRMLAFKGSMTGTGESVHVLAEAD